MRVAVTAWPDAPASLLLRWWWEAAGEAHPLSAQRLSLWVSRGMVLGARAQGPVGAGILLPPPVPGAEAFVPYLVVRGEDRGRGMGRALWEALVDEARRRGARRIRVGWPGKGSRGVPADMPAVAFFRHMGLKGEGEEAWVCRGVEGEAGWVLPARWRPLARGQEFLPGSRHLVVEQGGRPVALVQVHFRPWGLGPTLLEYGPAAVGEVRLHPGAKVPGMRARVELTALAHLAAEGAREVWVPAGPGSCQPECLRRILLGRRLS